jgi:sugar-specific transcriptional regulator TrmB
MKNVEKSLQYIGLTPKEAKIYLALLELGEAPVTEIARKTGIKRTTVYNLLPDLIDRGIVTSAPRNKRRIYFVEDPRALKEDVWEKEKAIDYLLPDLMRIQRIVPYKPHVTYYEGEGGMRDFYQDTLESSKPGDTILSFTGLYDFYQYMPREYERYYVDERIKRKIRIRIIAPHSAVAEAWNRTESKELRDVRIANSPEFRFNADMEIYANKVALISYRENFLGVIIESNEINQMMRLAFELMWSSAHIHAE